MLVSVGMINVMLLSLTRAVISVILVILPVFIFKICHQIVVGSDVKAFVQIRHAVRSYFLNFLSP